VGVGATAKGNPKWATTVESHPSKYEGWGTRAGRARGILPFKYDERDTRQIAKIESMCRNIKTLFNFDPPVTDEEVRAASLQFVRKISGFSKPSKANEEAFLSAIEEIAGISSRLLRSLETNAPPKNRDEEAAKAKARAAERFGA
jgi:hypothetical protein